MSRSTGDRIEAIASNVQATGREGGAATLDLRIRIPGPGSNFSGQVLALDRESGRIVESIMLSDWDHVIPVLDKVLSAAQASLHDA